LKYHRKIEADFFFAVVFPEYKAAEDFFLTIFLKIISLLMQLRFVRPYWFDKIMSLYAESFLPPWAYEL